MLTRFMMASFADFNHYARPSCLGVRVLLAEHELISNTLVCCIEQTLLQYICGIVKNLLAYLLS